MGSSPSCSTFERKVEKCMVNRENVESRRIISIKTLAPFSRTVAAVASAIQIQTDHGHSSGQAENSSLQNKVRLQGLKCQ